MIHFYFQAPNVADWISISLTIIGIVLGGLALLQWRKEKRYEIDLQAIAKARKALSYTKKILYRKMSRINDIVRPIEGLGDLQSISYHFSTVADMSEKYKGFDDELLIMKEKLKFHYKSDKNILYQYYDKISSVISIIEDQEYQISEEITKIINREASKEIDATDAATLMLKTVSEKYQYPEKNMSEIESIFKEIEKLNSPKWWQFF